MDISIMKWYWRQIIVKPIKESPLNGTRKSVLSLAFYIADGFSRLRNRHENGWLYDLKADIFIPKSGASLKVML